MDEGGVGMNDTMVTVVGNVATTPVFRELPSGPVTRFRIAVTARHFDRTRNAWTDGHTNFFTVWAWRQLGVNTQGSLAVGEPVIVQGRLRVRDEERGGQHWRSVDIDAYAIGHDLARGTSAFRRSGRTTDSSVKERSPVRGAADEPEFELPARPQPQPEPESQPGPQAAEPEQESGSGTGQHVGLEGLETELELDAAPVG
ncbi:putative Single-stranded DNA-binding protein 1 [Streptomyces aurantiacus JA 4570]|uniref:Single-stranded DNA-binding protein n=2 Tax=Streptomyces aurantiacus TaxID=47760 RepID=S3ZKZ1_9ACTN|nr:putative Single-stranded DNA-binding protein 1 [Streptomyces aurantiacus JA 4570]